MTTVLHLSTDITANDVDRFMELPFDVPSGVDKIRVQVSVQSIAEKPCIIDVGMCDPAQVRGWSGSTKYDLTVGRDEATPGYLKGHIPDGQWAILLGVYVVGKQGAHVEAVVTLYEMEYRWLKGDLHVHTVHSDGAYTLAELDAIAVKTGLDFVGLTDHNTVSQNYAYSRESQVTYIPAMELTTYHGHVNLFGVPIPCDDFRVQGATDVQRLLTEAKERGAQVSINHPYDDAGPSCQWQWGYDVPFDWLEVWNGPWRPSNAQSLALWQQMLVQGQRIVVVGGSDTHREHPYVRHGRPTTWVYTDSRSVTGILNGVQQGHVFLTYAPDGPAVDLRCGAAMMGDVVGPNNNEDIVVRVQRLQAGDEVKVISDKGVELSQITDESVVDHTWRLRRGDARFYRVEVWRHFPEVNKHLMAGLSNPIYLV